MLAILVALGLGLAPAPGRAAAAPAPIVTTASGLRIQTLKPGTGQPVTAPDTVLVTYEGRLADGTVFDAAPNPMPLPVAEVVPGFSEALQLMQKGGRYHIWLPPSLAYGAEGAGGVIPPNAEIQFTVEVVDILAAPVEAVPRQ